VQRHLSILQVTVDHYVSGRDSDGGTLGSWITLLPKSGKPSIHRAGGPEEPKLNTDEVTSIGDLGCPQRDPFYLDPSICQPPSGSWQSNMGETAPLASDLGSWPIRRI